MLASAKQISEGGVALIYICNVMPSLVCKLTSPWWFHRVSYNSRFIVANLLLVIGFRLVGSSLNYQTQLLGVCCCSLQAGLGEASFLALTTLYQPHTKTALTLWSAGTGLAGVFGYTWNFVLIESLGMSLEASLFIANSLVIVYVAAYLGLPAPFLPPNGEHSADPTVLVTTEMSTLNGKASVGRDHHCEQNTDVDRWQLISTKLWVYMLPLFVVYLSEYSMMSGTWAAIGFPVESEDARKQFYEYANWVYQLGVFLSRSSGSVLPASMFALQAMPVLQLLLLVLFTLISIFQFLYGWGLLALCFIAGTLGGAVYVNAFIRISMDIPAGPRQELAMSTCSMADSFGVLLADFIGLVMQSCIYKYHAIPGAKLSCPL